MCPIQNYLLSLGLTEYRQSILQIVKLAEAVDHSIANNSEFATAALASLPIQGVNIGFGCRVVDTGREHRVCEYRLCTQAVNTGCEHRL